MFHLLSKDALLSHSLETLMRNRKLLSPIKKKIFLKYIEAVTAAKAVQSMQYVSLIDEVCNFIHGTCEKVISLSDVKQPVA